MKHWNRRLGVKVLCFILCIPLAVLAVLGCLGIYGMLDYGVYEKSREEALQDTYQDMIGMDIQQALREKLINGIVQGRLSLSNADGTNLRYVLYDKYDKAIASNLTKKEQENMPQERMKVYFIAIVDHEDNYVYSMDVFDQDALDRGFFSHYTHYAYAYLQEELPVWDSYWEQYQIIGLMYTMRYHSFWIVAVLAILSITCFVNLMCVTGRKPGSQGFAESRLDKVPGELFLLGGFFALAFYHSYYWRNGYVFELVLSMAMVYACLGLLVVAARRIKMRQLLKNTIIWKAGSFLRGLIKGLPMVWRTGLVAGGILLWNFVIIVEILSRFHAISSRAALAILLIIVQAVVLALGLLWSATKLRKLQAAGKALADGNLSHQLDTSDLKWDFKTHGENLNSIAQGMTKAVKRQMQSERMKTELITNVSHDIKNPLTSIINYSDLIAASPCENPNHQEYARVLSRKSQHLKRLLEDLVEVSKAASGSLEVDMAPCEANVLLQQLAGEFADRCQQAELTLLVKQPEEALRIQVDSRRIWRVFENLMSNACKYSLPGSRVYLSLEKRGNTAVFTFRNTSREPLDISPEELLERFVRGDSARSTEGNGLGLSIAQSLTALQGGEMNLGIDGDLFKVTLTFPLEK